MPCALVTFIRTLSVGMDGGLGHIFHLPAIIRNRLCNIYGPHGVMYLQLLRVVACVSQHYYPTCNKNGQYRHRNLRPFPFRNGEPPPLFMTFLFRSSSALPTSPISPPPISLPLKWAQNSIHPQVELLLSITMRSPRIIMGRKKLGKFADISPGACAGCPNKSGL